MTTNTKLREALEIAIRQNSHDMLMTGEEIRQCEQALALTQHDTDDMHPKQESAYKSLVLALRSQLAHVQAQAAERDEAVATLASERAANAQLTAELEKAQEALAQHDEDKPIMWLEAEQSAKGCDPHDVFGKHSILYSTRIVKDEPVGNNAKWPLYTRPAATAGEVDAPIADNCKWIGGKCDCTRAQAQRCELVESRMPNRATPPAEKASAESDEVQK